MALVKSTQNKKLVPIWNQLNHKNFSYVTIMTLVKSTKHKKLAPNALGSHVKIENQANHKQLSYVNIMALVKSATNALGFTY